MGMRRPAPLATEPPYELPEPDVLASTVVHERLRERSDEFHEGLKSIWIDASWKNDAGASLKDTSFQKYVVKNGGPHIKPGMASEDIAKVLYLRCQLFAKQRKRKVQFKCWFYAVDDKETFKNSTQFSIDGTEDPSEHDISKNEVNPNQPAVDIQLPSINEVGPPMSDPDETNGKQRATFELMPTAMMVPKDAAVPADIPPWLGALVQHSMNLAANAGKETTVQAIALLEQSRLQHGKEVHDVSVIARDLIERVSTASSDQVNKCANAMVAVLGQINENHRNELASANAVRDQLVSVITMLSDEVASANRRVAKAEVRTAELAAKVGAEDEAKGVRKEAWAALEHGVHLVQQAQDKMYEAKVTALEAKVAQSTTPQEAKGGIVEKIYDDIKPFIALATSEVLDKRGNAHASKSAAKIAERFAPQDEFEDEDEEEGGEEETEQEEVVEAKMPAALRRQVKSVAEAVVEPAPNGATKPNVQPKQPDLSTLHGRLAALRSSLRPDQSDTLSKLMPQAAWIGFCNSAKATNEKVAVMQLLPLGAALKSDPELEAKVRAVLDLRQRALLERVIATVKVQLGMPASSAPAKRQPPTRPPSASPPAE